MKKTILVTLMTLGFSFQALAFDMNFPTQFPADWAVAMTERACGVRFKKGVVGETTKIQGGVLYTVYSNGKAVAAATAKSTSLFAKKTCL